MTDKSENIAERPLLETPKDVPWRGLPKPDETSDLTISEFCKELRIAQSTAWRMLNRKDVEGYRVGRIMKITRASVDAFKERNRYEPVRSAS